MRPSTLLTPLLMALVAASPITTNSNAKQAPLKDVIVSYPKGTPNSVVENAMDTIKDAGGIITHEYGLIVGFAAKVSSKALDMVSTLGVEYGVMVEEDQIVSINS